MTYTCVSKLSIIGSDNGLPLAQRQIIIWTNARMVIIGLLKKKLQGNHNRCSYIFFLENTFENIASNLATNRFRHHCVTVVLCNFATLHVSIKCRVLLHSTTWSITDSDTTKLKPCCAMAVWVVIREMGTTFDYFTLDCSFNLLLRHPRNSTALTYSLYLKISSLTLCDRNPPVRRIALYMSSL